MASEPNAESWRDAISSKEGLLTILWRMRADLERLVAEAGPSRMDLPGVAGEWSIKDVIAHLTAWRWWSVARMEAAVRNEVPTPPWSGGLDESTEENVDEINQQFHETARAKSTIEVLRDSRATFDRLEDAVMALSNEDLFEKGRYDWLDGYAASAVILGAASHLFEDHELAINVFLARGTQ